MSIIQVNGGSLIYCNKIKQLQRKIFTCIIDINLKHNVSSDTLQNSVVAFYKAKHVLTV